MRLDKFLKESRLIKRRTVAKEACERGRILQNGRVAKAGSEVKPGDVLELSFGARKLKVRVESIMEHVGKDKAREMYNIIE
ncbi:MAG: RNA-binding S4 domain-containing protein [Bacillota bacterium]|nr:RNA-binding S4 domain-containing protein [Bacillota bacterium]MDD3298728.1 RNA-binding S4 domain-containing protein [Bacillota bacterium]MDD3850291.1 RNA-binding S4 domain-containing protein [Bacillota bacterium]MDD4707616.1 RNA-binding S4 domain-containing protein [Bacillota bacterium]